MRNTKSVADSRLHAEKALKYWEQKLNELEQKRVTDENLDEDIVDLKDVPRDEKKAYQASVSNPIQMNEDLMHIFVELHANAKKACQAALQDELKDAEHNGLNIKYSNTCITGSVKNREFTPPADGTITIGIHLLDTARKGWFNRLMTGDLANRDLKTLGLTGKNVGIIGLKAYVNEFCGERYTNQVNEKTVFNGIGGADGQGGDNGGRESFFVTIKYPPIKMLGTAKTVSGGTNTASGTQSSGKDAQSAQSSGQTANSGVETKQQAQPSGQTAARSAEMNQRNGVVKDADAKQRKAGHEKSGETAERPFNDEFTGIDLPKRRQSFSGRSSSAGQTGSTTSVKKDAVKARTSLSSVKGTSNAKQDKPGKIDFSKLTPDDIKPVIGSLPSKPAMKTKDSSQKQAKSAKKQKETSSKQNSGKSKISAGKSKASKSETKDTGKKASDRKPKSGKQKKAAPKK